MHAIKSKRPSSLGYFAIAGLAILALSLALSTTTMAQSGAPTQVGVDAVREEPLSQTVPVIGRLVATESGDIAAEIQGSVSELFVSVGDRVRKGETLAKIDDVRLAQNKALREAEVKQQKAAVTAAKETIALLEQERRRLERLRKSAAFSQARLEDKIQEVQIAISNVTEAEAALARAEANLELARINLEDATVTAPFDGVITRKLVSAGTYVQAGEALVSMVNDQILEIEADVPAIRVAGLKPGSMVRFNVDINRDEQHEAAVRAVVPEENSRTRTRLVRFIAPTSLDDQLLAVGQSVTLLLPAGTDRNVISVHKDAILKRRGENIVYVIEGGAANPRPVRLGDAVGTRFEVLDGLEAGEQVVVRGNERLRPGQSVEAIEGEV